MLRKVSTLSIAGALIAWMLVSTPAYAAVSNGSTCTVINKTTKVSGFTYKCVTAVKSTVTLDGTKTTIYLPATAKTKNAKKYYLVSECINESTSYSKAVKDSATIATTTAESITKLDEQIAVQQLASTGVQATITNLTAKNTENNAQIAIQNEAILIAQKNVLDLNAKLPALDKQITDLTLSLEKLNASLAAINADKANKTAAKADAIIKYNAAISATKNAIASVTLNRGKIKIEINTLNSTITTLKSKNLELKRFISDNNAAIKDASSIAANIIALGKLKDAALLQQEQSKANLKNAENMRNSLCSAGF